MNQSAYDNRFRCAHLCIASTFTERMKNPNTDAEHVVAFCKSISPVEPVKLEVKPIRGLQAGDCFNNLDRVISKAGGSCLLGWALYEWPGVFIEAECHHVWKKKNGSLQDPTPRNDGRKRIVFLPDPSLSVFSFPDNKRLLLTDDPVITEYLSMIDKLKDGRLSSGKETLKLQALKDELEDKHGKEPLI